MSKKKIDISGEVFWKNGGKSKRAKTAWVSATTANETETTKCDDDGKFEFKDFSYSGSIAVVANHKRANEAVVQSHTPKEDKPDALKNLKLFLKPEVEKRSNSQGVIFFACCVVAMIVLLFLYWCTHNNAGFDERKAELLCELSQHKSSFCLESETAELASTKASQQTATTPQAASKTNESTEDGNIADEQPQSNAKEKGEALTSEAIVELVESYLLSLKSAKNEPSKASVDNVREKLKAWKGSIKDASSETEVKQENKQTAKQETPDQQAASEQEAEQETEQETEQAEETADANTEDDVAKEQPPKTPSESKASVISPQDQLSQLRVAIMELDAPYLWSSWPWLLLELWFWGMLGTIIQLVMRIGWYLRKDQYFERGTYMHCSHLVAVPVLAVIATLLLSMVKVGGGADGGDVLKLDSTQAMVIVSFLLAISPWKLWDYVLGRNAALTETTNDGG